MRLTYKFEEFFHPGTRFKLPMRVLELELPKRFPLDLDSSVQQVFRHGLHRWCRFSRNLDFAVSDAAQQCLLGTLRNVVNETEGIDAYEHGPAGIEQIVLQLVSDLQPLLSSLAERDSAFFDFVLRRESGGSERGYREAGERGERGKRGGGECGEE